MELLLFFTILCIGLLVGSWMARNELRTLLINRWLTRRPVEVMYTNPADPSQSLIFQKVQDYNQCEAPLIYLRDPNFDEQWAALLGVHPWKFSSRDRVYYSGANCSGNGFVATPGDETLPTGKLNDLQNITYAAGPPSNWPCWPLDPTQPDTNPCANAGTLFRQNGVAADRSIASVWTSLAPDCDVGAGGEFTTSGPYCLPAPDGLAGMWKGEDNFINSATGSIAVNAGGTTFVDAQINRGFAFAGSNGSNSNCFSPQANPNLEPATTLSIELWIRGPATAGPTLPIHKPGEGFAWGAYGIFQQGVNGWFFVDTDTTLGPSTLFKYIGPIFDTTWHHIAGTYDGSQIRGFNDGVEPFPPTALTGAIEYSNPTFYPEPPWYLSIGSRFCNFAGNDANSFEGEVDEVSIYNSVLTPAEIAAIYSAGTDEVPGIGKCSPVAVWDFGDLNGNCSGISCPPVIDGTGSVSDLTHTGLGAQGCAEVAWSDCSTAVNNQAILEAVPEDVLVTDTYLEFSIGCTPDSVFAPDSLSVFLGGPDSKNFAGRVHVRASDDGFATSSSATSPFLTCTTPLIGNSCDDETAIFDLTGITPAETLTFRILPENIAAMEGNQYFLTRLDDLVVTGACVDPDLIMTGSALGGALICEDLGASTLVPALFPVISVDSDGTNLLHNFPPPLSVFPPLFALEERQYVAPGATESDHPTITP